jgi:sulfoxide reductase heme-binding subunit YedZ
MARTDIRSAPFPAWLPFVPHKREPYAWLKPGIFLGGLVPLAYTFIRATQGELSANPIAQIENALGLTALIFLVASLVCTPARRLFGWTWPPRIRRELGLFAFGYASLHFLTYVMLDQFFDWNAILLDIAERPFITAGFAALVLLVPLALTSTPESIRKLGYKRWVRVHQLVYLAGALAALHFIWRVKIDLQQPLTYAVIIGTLLAIRLGFWLRSRRA